MTSANQGEAPHTLKTLQAMNEYSKAVESGLDEKQLLQRTCEVFVEFGDFRMAWFGYLELGSDGLIRPLAHAGDESARVDHPETNLENTAIVAVTFAEGPRSAHRAPLVRAHAAQQHRLRAGHREPAQKGRQGRRQAG